MNATLKFAFEKETRGAVRYQEVSDDGTPAFAPQVGSLYVRKSAMPGGKIPKVLTVTGHPHRKVWIRDERCCQRRHYYLQCFWPLRR